MGIADIRAGRARVAFIGSAEAPINAEVMEGYRARLLDLGFRSLFDCSNDGCGGFDFRFAVQLLPAPAMLMDIGDFAQLMALSLAQPLTRQHEVLRPQLW